MNGNSNRELAIKISVQHDPSSLQTAQSIASSIQSSVAQAASAASSGTGSPIDGLKASLDDVKAIEAYMTQFFSPAVSAALRQAGVDVDNLREKFDRLKQDMQEGNFNDALLSEIHRDLLVAQGQVDAHMGQAGQPLLAAPQSQRSEAADLNHQVQVYRQLYSASTDLVQSLGQVARSFALLTASSKESAQEMLKILMPIEAGVQFSSGFAGAVGGLSNFVGAATEYGAMRRGMAGPAAQVAGRRASMGVMRWSLPVALMAGAGYSIYEGSRPDDPHKMGVMDNMYSGMFSVGKWMGLFDEDPDKLESIGQGMMVAGGVIGGAVLMQMARSAQKQQQLRNRDMQIQQALQKRQFASGMRPLLYGWREMVARNSYRADEDQTEMYDELQSDTRRSLNLVRQDNNIDAREKFQIETQMYQRLIQLAEERGRAEIEMQRKVHMETIKTKQEELEALRKQQSELGNLVSRQESGLVSLAQMDPFQLDKTITAIDRARHGNANFDEALTAMQFARSPEEEKAFKNLLIDQSIEKLGPDAQFFLGDVENFRKQRQQLEELEAKIDAEVKVIVDLQDAENEIGKKVQEGVRDEVAKLLHEFKKRIDEEVKKNLTDEDLKGFRSLPL